MYSKVTNEQSGFTLTEIIVSISIVLLLMVTLFLALGPAFNKSKTYPSCASKLKQISVVYNIYYADNDGFPERSLLSEPSFPKKDHICPMNDVVFLDSYSRGEITNDLRTSDKYIDGTEIPHFDPSLDVLVRCGSHAYEGYDNHGKAIVIIDPKLHGKVLGVRLDGNVRKVPVIGCYEFGLMSVSDMKLYERLWKECDRK